MVTCDQARRWLPAYVLGELEEANRPELAEHLASCEACRAEEARAAHVLSALRAMPELPPSALRKERVLAAAKGFGSLTQPARPRRLPAIATLAALLLIGVMGSFMLKPRIASFTLRVEATEGVVERQEGQRWAAVSAGEALPSGAVIRTAAGRATLRSSRGDQVYLDVESRLDVEGTEAEDSLLLAQGRLYCEAARRTGRRLVIRTPVGRVEGGEATIEVTYLLASGVPLPPVASAQDEGIPFRGALKDVVPLVERSGEVRMTFSSSVADERIDFVVPAAAGPSDIVRAFDTTIESKRLARVARGDSYEVIRFVEEAPAPANPRMEVGVSEGRVEVVGEQGRQRVAEGEESVLDASGKPALPTPVSKGTIGAWRETPLSQPYAVLTKVPLPALRVRRVGRTVQDSLPIVEYSLPAVDTGDGTVAEVEPTKVVLARDDAELTVSVRVHLKYLK